MTTSNVTAAEVNVGMRVLYMGTPSTLIEFNLPVANDGANFQLSNAGTGAATVRFPTNSNVNIGVGGNGWFVFNSLLNRWRGTVSSGAIVQY
jgi:hypothetical protein